METKKVWWVLGIILAVILIIGLIISAIYKDKIFPNYVIDATTSDDAKVIDDFKKDLDTLANGGYTIEDSETMQADDECPTKNDQVWEHMWVRDYENVVVFYYPYKTDSGVIYPNIAFKKIAGNKLSIDGIMNATLECKRGGFLGAGKYKWDEAKIKLNFGSTPNYNYTQSSTGRSRSDNYISLTSVNLYYWHGYNHDRNMVSPSYNEIQLAREFVSKALLETVQNYFLKFDNLRLQVQTAEGNNVYAYLNSYFAYLYNSCRGGKSGDNMLVNVNDFLTYEIPESEQSNYPIPASKKADYPSDWEYYKMYKCDKFVRTIYINSKAFDIKIPSASGDYERNVECEVVPAQEKQYAKLLIKLRNYNNADLMSYDATESPVTITFVTDDDVIKTIVFDNKDTFATGETVTLTLNKTYSYTIKSNVLCFDNIEGSFETKNMFNLLTLNYTYLNGAVVCEFGLNVVGDIDLTAVDLSTNPVLIQLKDDNSTTYEIRISDNTYLSNNKMFTMVLPVGAYTYTIASDVLSFPTSDTSNLTVSTSSRQFVFNCLQKQTSFEIGAYDMASFEENPFGLDSLGKIGFFIPTENSTGSIKLNIFYNSDLSIEILEYCEGNLRTYSLSEWSTCNFSDEFARQIGFNSVYFAKTTSTAGVYTAEEESKTECTYQIRITYGDQIALSNAVPLITSALSSGLILFAVDVPTILFSVTT